MITYTKQNGCFFQMNEGAKHYHLYEMQAYKGKTTSDIIAIFDHDNDCIINHVYGANTISVDELDEVVTEYVTEYEAKQKAKTKTEVVANYKFSKAGVKAFLEHASDDFFEEMDKDWDLQNLAQYDIVISCGKHSISIPLGAEEWGCVEEMLEDAVEEYE